MTLTKRRSGERVRSIPVNDWNEFVASSHWVKSHRDALDIDQNGQRVSERIKNSTDAVLKPFDVVGLGDPIVTDDDSIKFNRTWDGVVPSASHFGSFAILKKEAAKLAAPDVVISGISPVLINIIHADHLYADIEVGSTNRLESNWVGSARIMWRQSGTGDKLAVVIAGDQPHVEYRATPQGNIAAGGSGTFDVTGFASGTVDDVKHNWMAGGKQLDLGTESIIRYFWHEAEWRVVEAACPT